MNISDITNKLGLRQPTQDKTKSVLRGEFRSLLDLAPGDKFRAGIVNVTLSGMTLKLENGQLIEAKALNSPDARIGDTVIFQVVESAKGQILLEMVKPGVEGGGQGANLSPGVIREALLSADMPLTDENAQLVMDLASSGMPITPKTLQTAAFFMYFDPNFTPSFQQVKFLLTEGFPPEAKSVEVFRDMLDKTTGLNRNIGELFDALMKLPDGAAKGDLLKLLTQAPSGAEGPTPVSQSVARLTLIEPLLPEQTALEDQNRLLDAAKKQLYVDVSRDGLENMGKFYKDLDGTMSRLAEQLKGNDSFEGLMRPLAQIQQGLEFMNQIDVTKEFLQIPYFTEHGGDISWNEAELHVFKRGGKKKKGGESQTALVALDYPELGHVEVVITRIGKRVNLQFRAETVKTLNILGGESYRLSGALSAAGFNIMGLSFKRLDEPIELTDAPEDEDGARITKYSVDMRV